jgi:hypothetical protein
MGVQHVDVDRCETWTRYRAGLCDSCHAHCCTMPVEVRLPDLVRLGLVDPFEAEHEAPKQIARRLEKAGRVDHFNFKHGIFTLARRASGDASSWTPPPGAAPCTRSARTPVASIRRSGRGRGTAPTARARPPAEPRLNPQAQPPTPRRDGVLHHSLLPSA